MNAERLKVDSNEVGDTTTLSPSGELDLATVETLNKHLSSALAAQPKTIVVDLGGLAFIDSTGLGAFVDFHHQCDEAGVGLEFDNVPDHVRRLMEITRLTELFTLR